MAEPETITLKNKPLEAEEKPSEIETKPSEPATFVDNAPKAQLTAAQKKRLKKKNKKLRDKAEGEQDKHGDEDDDDDVDDKCEEKETKEDQKSEKKDEKPIEKEKEKDVEQKKQGNEPKKGNPNPSVEIKRKDGVTLPNLEYGAQPGQKFYQTMPPTITISQQFPKHKYPFGKIEAYKDDNTTHRFTDLRRKAEESMSESIYNDFRQAAEAHRQLRAYVRQSLKPGVKLYDWVADLEKRGRNILGENANTHTKVGHAFPTGLSLNNCAAHYTPNPGDDRVLEKGDVVKVDIGLHVNGHIIDSAFSLCFDDQFQPLIESSREGTYTGLREAGVDARIAEIGASIEETISSYECEIGKKTFKIKPVSNLTGHQVGDYLVHCGKQVPSIHKGTDPSLRMEEGDFFAIETFGTTGKGRVIDQPDCSHYMMAPGAMGKINTLRNQSAKQLLNFINGHFKTLAWCKRWLHEWGETKYALALKQLVDSELVHPYPPCSDHTGSYVSQHEHTVAIKPTGKEIFSFGEDG